MLSRCCIDKKSSAELSEAINSMFRYYSNAALCYAYLEDVTEEAEDALENCRFLDQFQRSRWFTRGWTLQELIAPQHVLFYNVSWKPLGERSLLKRSVSEATGITTDVLDRTSSLFDFNVATRMSWAATRRTRRVEDEAYSLLGIFDVNMPLLYGEGPKAKFRLTETILNRPSSGPSGGGLWACAECCEWFEKSKLLEEHARATKHLAYKCTEVACRKGFSIRTALLRHVNTHSAVKANYCQHCDKSFHRKDHCLGHQSLCTGFSCHELHLGDARNTFGKRPAGTECPESGSDKRRLLRLLLRYYLANDTSDIDFSSMSRAVTADSEAISSGWVDRLCDSTRAACTKVQQVPDASTNDPNNVPFHPPVLPSARFGVDNVRHDDVVHSHSPKSLSDFSRSDTQGPSPVLPPDICVTEQPDVHDNCSSGANPSVTTTDLNSNLDIDKFNSAGYLSEGTSKPDKNNAINHTQNEFSGILDALGISATRPAPSFGTQERSQISDHKRAIPRKSRPSDRIDKANQSYYCASCSIYFKRSYEHRRHINVKHRSGNGFRCVAIGCSYKSKRRDKILAHCRNKHRHTIGREIFKAEADMEIQRPEVAMKSFACENRSAKCDEFDLGHVLSDTASDSWTSTLQSNLTDWNNDLFGNDWATGFAERDYPESSSELTPSESSRSSDISQAEKLRTNLEWDPFGIGDTYVPEILRLKTLGLGDASGKKTEDDVRMGDDDEGGDSQRKDTEWDWSLDGIDFDAFFSKNRDGKLFDASLAF